MKINELNKIAQKPKIYEPGTAVMWTDPHISQQLLNVHLSEHTDLASRKPETIKKTIDWILSLCEGLSLRILDLGCGPGLYTEQLADKGHRVTGVDFSQNSITYAKAQAEKKGLSIEYYCQDYTQLDLPENEFDLVMLIYTDLGPLLPEQRKALLANVMRVLKPGGRFVFDFLNDKTYKEKIAPKSWEVSEGGFWKNEAYVALSESFLYEEEKLILYQHIVLDAEENMQTYRFYTHFFSKEDIGNIVEDCGFTKSSFEDGVIPEGDGYGSEDVTFCITHKNPM